MIVNVNNTKDVDNIDRGGECNMHNIKIDNRVIYKVYSSCKPIQSIEI